MGLPVSYALGAPRPGRPGPVRALLAIGLLAAFVPERATPADPPRIRLEDVAREAGLAFVLENSPTPRKHLIETMPGGVAVLDYDGDGRLDVFFANGARIPGMEKEEPRFWNRLFRNQGAMKFADVTDAAGLRGAGYSMAAAVADYDNDGDADLFVGGVHRQALYRNTGGRFEEVAAKAGVASDQWVVGAGWLDYDNDGWLDLLAVNYTTWSADYDRFCGDAARGIRVYCHPKWFAKVPLTLYRGRGDGTFEDVSAKSGIAVHKGRGMGIAFADYDDDGFPDAYVANDKLPSFLFHNRKDGTFEETALLAGVSLPEHGQDVSAMGVDFKDYDNDGRPDIHVTALTGESFPLYRNLGRGLFQDVTHRSGLSRLVASRSGWANGLVDLDNDGWKDVFTANAHVNDEIEQFEKTTYRLPNSVFQNKGDGTFSDASVESGLGAGPPRGHRGAAFADLDQDGRLDVVVSSLQAPAELWRNHSRGTGHWLAVRLVGTKSNRDGIGAVVKLTATGDPRWREQVNHATTAVGYASSSAGPVHFGTGSATTIDTVEIRWPSGARQVLKGVASDQVLTVVEAATFVGAADEVPPLPSFAGDALPAGVRDRVAAAVRRAEELPPSASAAGELGMLLHAHDQASSAAAAYARARALDPSAFDWAYLAGVLHLRMGSAGEAASALRAAVARQPRSLPARLRLGEALLASGEASEARALYRAVLVEHPDTPQAHHGLGRAAAALGDAKMAAESQREAVRLFPAHGAAHYALGLLFRDLGRADEAKEHLRLFQHHSLDAPPLDDPVLDRVLALKQGTDDVLAESVRLAEIGDLAGAIRDSERALRMDPDLVRARANLIGLYARTGRWDKVEEQYRAAAGVASGRTEIDFNYGLALQQQGRREEAMEALRRVLVASPLHAPALNQLGLLLEAAGQLEDAAAHYRQAAASQAGFRVARFNLGRVLALLGRPGEAVQEFEQILEPDDEETPRYLYALGAAWARAGDREKALPLLEDARRRALGHGQADLVTSIERDLGRVKALPR